MCKTCVLLFEMKQSQQWNMLRTNSGLIVSGFGAKLVSGSETGAHRGAHWGGGRLSCTHCSLHRLSSLLCLLPLLLYASFLFRSPSLSLIVSFPRLASRALSRFPQPPLPPSFQKDLRHPSEISNCITVDSITNTSWRNPRVLLFY